MRLKYPALLALFLVPASQASDLLITGVFDGPLTGGTPKGVELFVKNDIADLSQCGLGSANNGEGTDGQEFTFPSGPVSAGSYLYVASESAQFTAFFGFAPTYTSGAMAINGDDAVELFCNDVVVDVFGDINVDGTGQPWDHLDGWAYRVAGTGPDGATFVIGNWTFSGVNGLEGGTTYDTTTSPFPLKSYADETSDGGDTGGGDAGGGDTGGGDAGGGDTGSDIISGSVCTNCPDLEKFKDLAAFNASDYYAAVQNEIDFGPNPAAVKTALNAVISSDIKFLSYGDVWTALTYTDEDPANTNNVILWYTGRSQAKSTNGSGAASSNPDNWNREHSWPNSHGFASQSFEAYNDIHHLRATDISVNSSRSNLDFDNSDSPLAESPSSRIDSNSFEPRDDIKGDVARMMFYLDTRYEGSGSDNTPDLVLVNRVTSSGEPNLGMLCTLIAWNSADPVDASEQRRNDRIYELQGNRNPFIDNPAWVELLYPAASCDSTGGGDTGGGDTGGGDTGGGDTGGGDTGGGDTGGGDTNNGAPLILSGIIDGPLSGGVPKAIEIYVNEDIADLSQCGLGLATNGGQGNGQGYTFPAGAASAGSFIYVASESPGFTAFFGFAPDYTSSVANFNGDDVMELYCEGEVIDVFGEKGVDGTGTGWEYLDGWAYRQSETGPDGANFVLANWGFSGINVLDGETNNATAATPFPTATFFAAVPEIFISEYIEGSSNNKALEFYNPSSVAVDLTPYSLLRSTNGGTSEATIDLVGSIAPYDVFVIANNSSVTAILDVADQLSSNINHNGDDAYVLYKDGVVIDSFGRVGERAVWGSGDTTSQNNTLVRKSSVKQGDTIVDDAFDPVLEWDGFAQDTFEFLGSYGSNGGDTGGDVVLGQCADPATLISAVQGSGLVSPMVGEDKVVEAVVTASFPALSGFFVQEESVDMDTDSQTSEGIFVYYTGTLPAVGSVVRVLGKVEEYFEKTQLNVSTAPLVCGSDSVAAVSLSLPFADPQAPEALEGMLVNTAQELTVSDNYNLGQFGEVTLSNGRLYNPTNLYPAGSPEAQAVATANTLNRVILDDGMNGTNPTDVIYPTGGLSADNTLRTGDTVSTLSGVIDYSFSQYRIIPTVAPTFVASNARTAQPQVSLGNLKVASLNVLNYFTTLDLPGVSPDPRGADSAEELVRQKAKTVAAIIALDADIVGLMEIENNGTTSGSALDDLVQGLNAQLGAGTYAAVNTGSSVGTDLITTAFIYKPAVVSLSGSVKINNNSVFSRPPIAQTFALNSNGETLAVVVNHFKSKGCGGANGLDLDQNDGQSCFNNRRVQQAQALATWLATDASLSAQSRQLIIGDLNAYAKEDPILALQASGFTNLIEHFQGAEAYSYSFGGTVGYLDHALASADLLAVAVDANDWHINADEPRVLDYNLENKTPDQQSLFFAPDPYRMSDHDPVVMTFQLDAASVKGDWDGDGDVDINDIRALTLAIQKRLPIDLAFDLNNDGVVNALDTRVMQTLCTRTRCAA